LHLYTVEAGCLATAAAVAKRSMISSISAGRSSRGVVAPDSFVGIVLGATGVCPSAKGLAWRGPLQRHLIKLRTRGS
jgi:hypothetical protein